MKRNIDNIQRKVFLSKDGEEYGTIRKIYSECDWIPKGWTAFAEDGCGNFFI